jgi:hypothetical protein
MSVTVWTNTMHEDTLRENGYEIPKFPLTGNVTYDGNIVGYIDNFVGLTIKDESYIDELKELIPSAGFWNC